MKERVSTAGGKISNARSSKKCKCALEPYNSQVANFWPKARHPHTPHTHAHARTHTPFVRLDHPTPSQKSCIRPCRVIKFGPHATSPLPKCSAEKYAVPCDLWIKPYLRHVRTDTSSQPCLHSVYMVFTRLFTQCNSDIVKQSIQSNCIV